jgi:hypothetical protein
MKFSLILFFLIIIINNQSFSLIDENHSVQFQEFFDNIDNGIIADIAYLGNDSIDSVSTENSGVMEDYDSLRISQSDFMYADNLRYTLNGNLPLIETDIDYLRLGLVTGVVSGFMIGQHIYQANTIWSEKSHFRIIEDGQYALYSDKIGHFYGAYLSGYVYTELLMWSGIGRETATVTGAIMGLAYSTYVEIMDGYAENWGFSPSDFYSDVAGFGFFLLQHYVPWFQNITPKFQYIPAEWHGERRRDPSEFFIDDYSSQSLYFSLNVYNVLPDNLKQYWLPWLQLTVGYAARNLVDPLAANSSYDPKYSTIYAPGIAGSPRLIIGLDYDLVKLLPDGPPIWNWFRQSLNFFKLPAPAIEISERGTRFVLMYPFFPL